MAAILEVAAASALVSITTGQTQYFMACESYLKSSTIEDRGKTIRRTAGTFSKIYIRIVTNASTANGTFRLHKNKTTNSSQSVSITSGTTGEFTDSSNTDTVTAGDIWAFQIIGGTGGTTTFGVASLVFTPTSGTVKRVSGASGTTLATGATKNTEITGNIGLTPTEAQSQYKIRTGATLQNLYVNITAYSANKTYTAVSRIGGANGNMAISITGTGVLEDTSHTDTVSSTNLINYQISAPSGTGSLDLYGFGMDISYTTAGVYEMATSGLTGTIATSQTQYFPFGGGTASGYTTEADMNTKAQVAMTASILRVDALSNGVSAASTFRLRKNNGNGNQSVSITASTSGWFEDAVNTDVLAATDEMDYQIVTGATGTTLKINCIGLLMSPTSTGTNMQISVSSAWKSVSTAQIYVSSAWKAVAGIQQYVSSAWKKVF